ncbi:hypothetical protein BT96DRAFT_918780 [Gymnopus androsaceus JB14]|uniref:Uncharacterized protein n=1 Tax=Gymnopus androsaceus JB14 TaxID=1447944 RepID=A0A6A4HX91_9AGAR|nr:hypothetical protein BT96DRAFT_918780 [Gymnopus androsaceus JB14]
MSLERYVGERNLSPVEIVPKGTLLTLRQWSPYGSSNSIRTLVESTVLQRSMASIKMLNVTRSPVNPNSSTRYFLTESFVYQNF